MFKKLSLIFFSLLVGFGLYIGYSAVLVPNLIITQAPRKPGHHLEDWNNPSKELDELIGKTIPLLEELFTDPEDWRRNPQNISGNDQWLLLYRKKPQILSGNMGFAFESCTIVIPSSDEKLTPKERFRQAIVIETNDKLDIRLKRPLNLQALSGMTSDYFERGHLYGMVSIWTNMNPDTADDDFLLTTRDVTFTLEQVTASADVMIHYGNKLAEGSGLTVDLETPFGMPASADSAGTDNPLTAAFRDGNLGGGFSIRSVKLNKLTRLEFSFPDYLPTLPDLGNLNFSSHGGGSEEPREEEGAKEEQTVSIDVRCSGNVVFSPSTDNPACWLVKFVNDVEITAVHQERDPDSLRCDHLFLFLEDSERRKVWDEFGKDYKGKKKLSGRITQLCPVTLKAFGSAERDAALRLSNNVMSAEAGIILCEIDTQKVSFQPWQEQESEEIAKQVSITSGSSRIVSNRIDFISHGKDNGELLADSGSFEGEVPAQSPDGNMSKIRMKWKEGLKIAPYSQVPDLYAVTLTGGIQFDWDAVGTLTAEKADFWFKIRQGGGNSGSFGQSRSISPNAAQLRGNVCMNTLRGDCQIRDVMDILFSEKEQSDEQVSSSAGTPAKTGQSEPLFGQSGSLMGKEGDTKFSMTGGSLKIWMLFDENKKARTSRVQIQDQLLFIETDSDGKESLRISGNDVRIDDPGSDTVSVRLLGRPANFTGSGLNLSGFDIRVNRAKNTFSVVGSGRLRFTPQVSGKTETAEENGAGTPLFPALSGEPIEVWWPSGMNFDGKSLVFEGRTAGEGKTGTKTSDTDLVKVQQRHSLEMKSPLICLTLKRPIEIFDFEMGKEGTDPKKLEIDQAICQGSPTTPVTVTWFGSVPNGDQKTGGKKGSLRGRGTGEVAYAAFKVDTGDFAAKGPGWFGGAVETPKDALGKVQNQNKEPEKKNQALLEPKPWTLFHLVFHDKMTGNVRQRNAKIDEGVRMVLGTSERSDDVLDVNQHQTFPPDAFFLTCNELSVAEALSSSEQEHLFEMTAYGNTRFDYQTYTGLGDALKYDHRKRTIIMQGGTTPASLSRQTRPGAPVDSQEFSSASFNLETKKVDLNLSGTGFSMEK